MTELLVLQHHPDTGPSAFREVLDLRSSIVPWRLVDLADGDPLPTDPAAVAGILTMGGPMSVTDEEGWMSDERSFLRGAVEAEVPVLGICLGAQLLGASLGGEVAARQEPRAAFLPLRRSVAGTENAVTAGWPDGAAALLFHEDEVVRYPDGAQPLLTGPDGEVAAWGIGSAVAVQAHPEVTSEQLLRWLELPALADLCRRAGVAPDVLIDEALRREPFTVPLGQALVGRWLDGPIRGRVG